MKKVALSLALFLSAASANSALIPVTNASFEDGLALNLGLSDPDGPYMTGDFTGWTVDVGAGRYDSNGTLTPEAWDGNISAWSNGGSLTQALGVNLAANTTYTLSLYIGDRNDTPFTGFTVELLSDGNPLLGGTTTFSPPADGGWSLYSYEYTSIVSGGPLGIRLASNGLQTNFDSVSLNAVAAIPEPASYAMFIAGLGLLGFAARRKT